ncbi:MAG: M48 family metallopeptidase [Fimbriimonas sp.]
MKRTLHEQIAANKRASVIYSIFLILLLAGLGTAMAGAYYPRQWYLGTLGATALGFIMAMVARYSGSSIILSISGAREATQAEDRMLNNVVEEMAIAGGIPKPKVYVIDDSSPNAFATGSDPDHAIVAITTGLMSKLDRDELQGVIAHEMSHIRNYDIRFMTTIAMIAGLIPLLADMFLRMQFWGGGRRDRDKDSGLASIFAIVGLVLAILAPIFAKLLEMAVSRQREYLADAGAAEMTRYPEGLARALQKIAMDPDPLEAANRATQHMYIVNPMHLSGDDMISAFSTHPPTHDRIQRLLNMMGSTTIEGAAPPTIQAR